MKTFVFMNGKKEVARLSEADFPNLIELSASMGEIIRVTEMVFDEEITTIKIVESEDDK